MKYNEPQKTHSTTSNAREQFKSILLSTCVFFTLFSMVILTTQLFGQNDLIKPLRFFLLLPFALCISLSNLILKSKTISTALKLILHFTALAASFYLCLCTTIKNVKPIILILILGVAYIIIAAPVVIILKHRNKKNESKPEYVSMFKKSSK